MKNQPEYNLQVAISQYLSFQYPNVLFMSDTVASIKLTFPQQNRNKKIQCNNFKCPDLMIFKPNGKYHGLFIELKVESPFKKNGDLKKSGHLKAQRNTIEQLNKIGYYACFSWGFEMTKELIDNYLKEKK